MKTEIVWKFWTFMTFEHLWTSLANLDKFGFFSQLLACVPSDIPMFESFNLNPRNSVPHVVLWRQEELTEFTNNLHADLARSIKSWLNPQHQADISRESWERNGFYWQINTRKCILQSYEYVHMVYMTICVSVYIYIHVICVYMHIHVVKLL